MHTSFIDLKVFNEFPEVVDDLIFRFAYDTTRDILHIKANKARTLTYNMPVPTAWKRFFSLNEVHRFAFDWPAFLKNVDADPVYIPAVTETLNMLNWNSLRSKNNAITRFVRTSTKTSLKRRLKDELMRRNVIHMVWHLLTCAGRGDFTTAAWRNNNYARYLSIPHFNRPLSSYYPAGPHLSAWDILVHRQSTPTNGFFFF